MIGIRGEEGPTRRNQGVRECGEGKLRKNVVKGNYVRLRKLFADVVLLFVMLNTNALLLKIKIVRATLEAPPHQCFPRRKAPCSGLHSGIDRIFGPSWESKTTERTRPPNHRVDRISTSDLTKARPSLSSQASTENGAHSASLPPASLLPRRRPRLGRLPS